MKKLLKKNKNTLYIDLDNTLTIPNIQKSYLELDVNNDIKQTISQAKKKNYDVVIYTSRGMLSYNKNITEIKRKVLPNIKKWLNKNEIYYDDIFIGKPFCGSNGWYVDDKNLSKKQFKIKFFGPLSKNQIDIVIPCFNEEGNLSIIDDEIEELEKIINIRNVILVNNGSEDSTKEEIDKLVLKDAKYITIDLKSNKGYGGAIIQGIKRSKGEVVMILHADMQFEPSQFITSNLESLNGFNRKTLIAPKRVNRSIGAKFNSYLLKIILSILFLKKLSDFNGQPKIFFKESIIDDIDKMPNNYCFDLALFLAFDKKITPPVLEKDRLFGRSSWRGFKNKLIVLFEYLMFAILR
jgi:capsule biosynthesis phosphatase